MPCSKIDKIAKIRATLSAWAQFEPDIIPTRILSKAEENENTYFDVKDYKFNHLHKYYTFLNENGNLKENDSGHINSLDAVERYKPTYIPVYGLFVADKGKIRLDAYIVNPYAANEKVPSFKIEDPNAKFNSTKENLITVNIKEVSSFDELPLRWELLFKRAYVDIFYKSDYVNYDDVKTQISFQYDLESKQILDLIPNSPNYITQVPLIRELIITETPKESDDNKFIHFALTSTGFLWNNIKEPNIVEHDINKLTVDRYLEEMFINGYYCPVILIPYILDEDGYSPNGYYIPKDIDFVVTAGHQNDSDTFLYIKSDELSTLPYIKYIELLIGKVIDISFNIAYRDVDKVYILYSGTDRTGYNITNVSIVDHNELSIPREKLLDIDVPRLIKTYTPHNMFKEAKDVKQYLIDIFQNKDMLAYIMTRSEKFIDDNVNKDRNYIDKLISMLNSLGMNIPNYEQSSFSNVNELRDFTRLLSMNHSELIGNEVSENLDILVTPLYTGKHIGERIYIDDKLLLNCRNEIIGIKRKTKNDYVTELLSEDDYSEWFVLKEDYSRVTRLISFHSAFEYDKISDTDDLTTVVREVGFDEYIEKWGWNLLLSKADPGVTLLNRIDTLYTFYLLKRKGISKRINNFIDEKYLNDNIIDKDSWYEDWGITLDIIIKIIIEALNYEKDDIFDNNIKVISTTVFSFIVPKSERERTVDMAEIFNEIFGPYNARSIPADYKYKWDDGEEKSIVNINRLNTTFVNDSIRPILHKMELYGDMRAYITENNTNLTDLYYRAAYIKSPYLLGVIYVLKDHKTNTKYPQSIMMEYRDDDPEH